MMLTFGISTTSRPDGPTMDDSLQVVAIIRIHVVLTISSCSHHQICRWRSVTAVVRGMLPQNSASHRLRDCESRVTSSPPRGGGPRPELVVTLKQEPKSQRSCPDSATGGCWRGIRRESEDPRSSPRHWLCRLPEGAT